MKNKGFTLIELLAVIVILAIIALIATPVILNIIEDSREESNKRSADNYGKAVTNAVAKYQLNHTTESISGDFTPDENKPKTLVNDKGQELEVEYDGSDVICNKINISKTGNLYMTGCSVGGTEVKDYEYGENPDSQNTGQVCSATQGDGTNLGDMINCGTENFYVLSNDGTNIKMLTEKVIGPISDDLSPTVTLTGDIKQIDGEALIPFTTENNYYWLDSNNNLKAEYSDSYVYDDNSLIYPYVIKYVSYLTDTINLNVLSAELMDFNEFKIYAECDESTYTCSGDEWLFLPRYWFGSYAGSQAYVYYIMGSGRMPFDDSPSITFISNASIRPVITISTSALN